jgi:hypothetical protein
MGPPGAERLYQTGQIYVTASAARTYADWGGWQVEEARRDLTELLLDATQRETERPPELWRIRSRTESVDITARVAREGRLAVVVSINARRYS